MKSKKMEKIYQINLKKKKTKFTALIFIIVKFRPRHIKKRELYTALDYKTQ